MTYGFFAISETETSAEQTTSQLKDEKQLRKNYETQLSTMREELAEVKGKCDILEKVSLFLHSKDLGFALNFNLHQ